MNKRKEFSHVIHALSKMRRKGQQNTKVYEGLLKRAQELNPTPQTPIGFYLD